jgi:multiple sugar transport system permease protein
MIAPGRRLAARAALYVLLSVLAGLTIFPIAWMVLSAFKSVDVMFRYPPVLLPPRWRIENFHEVFTLSPFARYLFNSFYVATAVTVVALLFHSMAGYALARLRFRGNAFIFLAIVSTLFIPLYAITIPLFLVVQQLGWVNTYWGLIVPSIFNAFGIFLFRQFFLSLPRELEDAARIDGCGRIGVFFRIALPLARPVIATLAVFSFLYNWDNFFWPLIVTSSTEMRVIQVGVAAFYDVYNPRWNLMLAGATIAVVPSFVLFCLLQRHLVQSIQTTGLKG